MLKTILYRVIPKSLRNFRPLRYSSRDGQAKGEHVNRGRDTPIFCPTLQVLDMSTLGDGSCHPCNHVPATQCNVCGRNLITGLTSAASPSVDISSTCKVRQKLGMSVPLLTCSPLARPSRLLYRRGRKFRRDLGITLYLSNIRRLTADYHFSPKKFEATGCSIIFVTMSRQKAFLATKFYLLCKTRIFLVFRFLGCDAASLGNCFQTFRKKISPSSS